jgi:hypothetical protein
VANITKSASFSILSACLIKSTSIESSDSGWAYALGRLPLCGTAANEVCSAIGDPGYPDPKKEQRKKKKRKAQATMYENGGSPTLLLPV